MSVLMIVNLKIIARKLLDPAKLAATKVFDIHKLSQIIVICEDKNFMLTDFKIVSPVLKNLDNG